MSGDGRRGFATAPILDSTHSQIALTTNQNLLLSGPPFVPPVLKDHQQPMASPISVIQTTWLGIRFALFQRSDGAFQFAEQHAFREDLAQWLGNEPDPESQDWVSLFSSGLYADAESAKRDMVVAAEDCEDT